MKITVIKKAEVKKADGPQCPWVIEDMLPTTRK
jgi:hypothetical protein